VAAIPLLAVLVTVPLGYLFFWGTANALSWGAPFHLGPYYWIPVLLPLAVFGARGFAVLRAWSPVGGGAALIAMAALAGVVTVAALRTGAHYSDSDEVVWQDIERADLHDAVVFLPVNQLGHPFQDAQNDASYDDDVLWAIDRGACANAEVLRTFSGRTAYRLRIGGHYRATPVDPGLVALVERYEPPCEEP
jgi:hypothetical protein